VAKRKTKRAQPGGGGAGVRKRSGAAEPGEAPPYARDPRWSRQWVGANGPGDTGWRDIWQGADGGELVFWFDEHARPDRRFPLDAGRAVAFFERLLKHDQGEFYGKPFLLQPWQRAATRAIFGWKRADGRRRVREVFVFIASGNGKSAWLSGLGLLMLFASGEAGAEVFNLAGADKSQASIVFDTAAHMVEMEPRLARLAEVFAGQHKNAPRAIVKRADRSSFRVLSSMDKTKPGLRPSCVLVDEVWVLTPQKEHTLELLETMMAKRSQPLELLATTAGFDLNNSVAGKKYKYAVAVRDGKIVDPYFLPVIYEWPRNAKGEYLDWTAAEYLPQSNPSLGVTIQLDDLVAELEKAKADPSKENNYRRQRCNQWTKQVTRWLREGAWTACRGPLGRAELAAALRGMSAYYAFDLSTTRDLTAVCVVVPISGPVTRPASAPEDPTSGASPEGASADAAADAPSTPTFAALWRFYMPAENVAERTKEDGVRYDLHARGCICATASDAKTALDCPAALHLTPGEVVDYDFILRDILALNERYPGVEFAFDPAGAQALMTRLGAEVGEERVLTFHQSFSKLSPAVIDAERVILAGELWHAGDALAEMCVDNVALQIDPGGRRRPSKKHATGRIDGAVAFLMALHRASVKTEAENVVDGAVLL
jgi:phage terminase large subunit-like protein